MGYLTKICFTILFFWASFSPAQNSVIEYPNWFLYPAQFGNITTGFSSPDSTSKQNAAKMKAVFNSSVVKGKVFLYEVTNDYDLNKYSDYYYYYSDSTARDYESKLISLDKRIINVLNNEYIEAFAIDSTNSFQFNYIDINSIKKPTWIKKSFYEKDGYYYSVGMFTSIGRDNDAWITSEEKAMFNLLRNIYSNIYGIKKNFDSEIDSEDAYENIIAHKINAQIKNIEILERYPDREAQLYFTLIRIKKEEIKIID